MTFIEDILERLQRRGPATVLQQIHGRQRAATSGEQLLHMVAAARAFVRGRGLTPGDRCALIGPNGARWTALNLGILAEGLIAVPLYHRLPHEELLYALRDCACALTCCADETLACALRQASSDQLPVCTFEEVFGPRVVRDATTDTAALVPADPVTIIYTSGTSGRSKGVVLTLGGVQHMLECTGAQLDQVLDGIRPPQRIFHYLPCCFAGSWMLMLTALSRDGELSFATDLQQLPAEIRAARPHVMLNVPALLERVRRTIEQRFAGAGLLAWAFRRSRRAWLAVDHGNPTRADRLWERLAGRLLFGRLRRRIGRDLLALICGSAPLAEDTQRFFHMLGLPVLQVYGLTETTAICTMDQVQRVQVGRVGRAIPGAEMKLGPNGEILVRGPHLFAGYWNRPDDTAAVMSDDWFHTGDQGQVDESGNWQIVGRLKNLIILSSGHNVVPDPIEQRLLHTVTGASQVMLVGNQRSHLAAIVTGPVSDEAVRAGLETLNPALPHYQRVHRYCLHVEPFSQENGLLTANGKLRREAIARKLAGQIERLYEKTTT